MTIAITGASGAMGNVGVQRLVLASTANFYAPDMAEATETSPVMPTSRTLYLGSKAVQEWTAASLARQHGMSFAALRIASVVGTGRSVIDHFARQLIAGETVTIARHGAFGADLVHLDDVIAAFLLAVDQSLEGIWNVSSGQRKLLVDIAADLALFAGRDAASAVKVERDGEPDCGFPAINCNKFLAVGYCPKPYPELIRTLLASAGMETRERFASGVGQ